MVIKLSMGVLEDIKRREKEHDDNCYMKGAKYYHSKKAQTAGKRIYNDKKKYVKSHPEDFLIVGAHIHSHFWYNVHEVPAGEREIFRLTGEGKYYEDQKDYEKAIRLYQRAYDQTMRILGGEIKQLVREHGPGDYLYTSKIKQRIRVCEKALLKSKVSKLEAKAKKLEKVNPAEAINVYNELNKLKPGLKKYNKRIEMCKKKL